MGEVHEIPLEMVRGVGRRYPNIWRALDQLRAAGAGSWPSWCWLPDRPIWRHLERDYFPSMMAQDLSGDLMQYLADFFAISVPGAWRVSQGIYQFDPDVMDHVWNTPVTGRLPAQLFEHLPEWACYVPVDPPRDRIQGFFVSLSIGEDNPVLKFVGSKTDDDVPFVAPIDLVPGLSLEECVERISAEGEQVYTELTGQTLANLPLTYMVSSVQPMVSVALYLCSTTAEFLPRGGGDARPRNSDPTPTRRTGPRFFPPDEPRRWEVSYRLGAALRAGGAAAEEEDAPPREAGQRARLRPHIRRAHWHSYWIGPRNEPEKRRVRVRWLPPMPIAVEDPQDIVPTVRPVEYIGGQEEWPEQSSPISSTTSPPTRTGVSP